MDKIVLRNAELTADVVSMGAELKGLRLADGRDMLWQGDLNSWPRSAPILFPIVGRLRGDFFLYADCKYLLTQHGFARDREFTLLRHDEASAAFVLHADELSLSHYPFPFELQVAYTLDGRTLTTRLTVKNTGSDPMPFAIGGHPGFHWPLDKRFQKHDYVLVFEKPEQAQRDLVHDGLLTGEQAPLPWQENVLPLDETLFAEDAIVLRQPASHWVRYQPRQGGLAVQVDFMGFPDLGIWSKPGGAPFLCIEPWHGHASFMDESGELLEKRDMLSVEPGMEFACEYRIAVLEAPAIAAPVSGL